MSVQKCPQFAVNSQPATRNLPFYCPLKVGSELAPEWTMKSPLRWSPSPQGRVGTRDGKSDIEMLQAVAVPSRSGRDQAAAGQIAQAEIIAVPSRSGRDLRASWWGCRGIKLSPSPQGRVGTYRTRFTYQWGARSPSPQGRVGTRWDFDFHVAGTCRRPLKVGSGRFGLHQQETTLHVAVPSRSGRDSSLQNLRGWVGTIAVTSRSGQIELRVER